MWLGFHHKVYANTLHYMKNKGALKVSNRSMNFNFLLTYLDWFDDTLNCAGCRWILLKLVEGCKYSADWIDCDCDWGGFASRRPTSIWTQSEIEKTTDIAEGIWVCLSKQPEVHPWPNATLVDFLYPVRLRNNWKAHEDMRESITFIEFFLCLSLSILFNMYTHRLYCRYACMASYT